MLKGTQILLLIGSCLVAGTARAQIPADQLLKQLRPSADVNDYAEILTPQDREALEQRCRELREKTDAELAVVIIKSLQGGQIDDFTNRLFAQWKVGKKGKDNGVMLLVAMEDRKARIEVGYGLEGIIPDILANRILEQNLFPAFKQKRYRDGLFDSVNRIIELIERNEPPKPEELRDLKKQLPIGSIIFMLVFFSVFVSVGWFFGGIGAASRMFGLLCFGAFFGGVPMLMALALLGKIGALVLTPLGVIMFILGWRTGSNTPRNRNSTRGGGFGGTSTWPAWSSGPYRSSGSWGSGGGFSSSWGGFGGGSSGGGGASGGW